MAAYNSMPQLPPGAQAGAMGMNPGQQLGMDGFDHEINFDAEFPLNHGTNGGGLPMSFSAINFETFPTFEDPFPSYSTTNRQPVYEPPPIEADVGDGSSPEQVDNKLLGFSAPTQKASLVDDSSGTYTDVPMVAELYGMFFIAEDVSSADATGNGTTAPRPVELTCYRRNLWQVSGHIVLPRQVSHIINDQGRRVPILELAATITATESIDGKPTEIISIPWKSNAGAENDALSKVATAPPRVPLDPGSASDIAATRVQHQVSWKRLQFKHATANNGRRKGMQQHYVVRISLMGKMKSGEWIKITEVQSAPVIVRGRSPRNFDSKKDVPLIPDKKGERRHTESVKAEKSEAPSLQKFPSTGSIPKTMDWATPQPYTPPGQGAHPSKKLATTSPKPANRTNFAPWGSSASTVAGTPQSSTSVSMSTAATSMRHGTGAPIHLPLSDFDDERSPSRSVEMQSPQHRQPTGSVSGQGGRDDDELLYEYFPLSMDDWRQPVDAVYRPHVVHHVPADAKAQRGKGKTKRYFEE